MNRYKYILFCLFLSGLVSAAAQSPADSIYVAVSGIVKDQSSKKPLSYAVVSVAGGTEATVTNADGEFTFKVLAPISGTVLEISHLGYDNKRVGLGDEEPHLSTIWLNPATLVLQEVVVDGYGARELVEAAIDKIPDNYSSEANRLTGFYRETVRKRRNYINIAEAVVDMYKSAYSKSDYRDRVRILKGRRLLSPKKSDTLAVKLLGGPTGAIYMDVVKNPDLLLSREVLPLYDFRIETPVAIDKRPQYVVSFKPNRTLPFALYHGKFYIDRERLSFTRAEFFLDMSDRNKATQAVLNKKPRGMRFTPTKVSYEVNYTDYNGKTYLSYVRNEIHFKCDWRRKLFATSYLVTAEMVVTDIEPTDSRISYKESFKESHVLSDDVSLFYDPDFWGNYNIIKPDESLEKAVGRLKKMQEK